MDAKRWVSMRMARQDMAYSAGLYLWSDVRISVAAQLPLYEWWERWREMIPEYKEVETQQARRENVIARLRVSSSNWSGRDGQSYN